MEGNERLRCPRLPIFNDPVWYNETISAYNAYKNGFLPHAGGMMDQNSAFPLIMSTIDAVIAETAEILAQRARTKKNLEDQQKAPTT